MHTRPSTRITSLLLTGGLALSTLLGCSPADEPAAPHSVRFALDWAPNTNHIGVFVAEALGYFDEAGVEVEILPYASTPVSELVSAGAADFGIAGQAVVQLARTSGLDVISTYRITQTEVGEVVYLSDDITRPADLDGLTFGGFGSPLYSSMVRAMVRHDGGEGDFTEVILDTGAYDALAGGSVDFTLSVSTWESLQAELDGRPYRSFAYQDYGLPELQAVGIISSDAFLADEPEAADAFIGAVQRGYQYAADNPTEAAELLIEANPEVLGNAEELVRRSVETLAQDGYFVADGVTTGAANPSTWADYGAFLLDNAILVDAEGTTVTEEPDWSDYYTDALLD